MPKIFALRDRLMEVQQSLADDDDDVRGKRVGVDADVKFDDFDDLSTKSFGYQIFESIFSKKMTTTCWSKYHKNVFFFFVVDDPEIS